MKTDLVRHRHIAPRLSNGQKRVGFGSALPEHIKEGFRMIAYAEGCSMSWAMERLIVQHFNLERPEYVIPKTLLLAAPGEAAAFLAAPTPPMATRRRPKNVTPPDVLRRITRERKDSRRAVATKGRSNGRASRTN